MYCGAYLREKLVKIAKLYWIIPCIALTSCGTSALLSTKGQIPYPNGITYNLPQTKLEFIIQQDYLAPGWMEISALHAQAWTEAVLGKPATSNEPATAAETLEGVPERRIRDGVTIISRFRSWKEKVANNDTIKYAAYFPSRKVLGYTLTVTPQDGPDPRQGYTLAYDPSVLHDERLCVGVKANGLLQTVQYAGDDRTQDILFNLTRTFTAFSQPTASKAFPEEITDPRSKISLPVKRTIDFWRTDYDHSNRPYNPDVAELTDAMRATFGEDIRIDFGEAANIFLAPAREFAVKKCGADKACFAQTWHELVNARCNEKEICYRRKVQVPIRISRANGRILDEKNVEMVNNLDTGALSIERAFLVEKITKLWFDDGALTGVVIRKPSEAQATALLPVTVVSAVLSSPVGLLSQVFNGSPSTQLALANQLGQAQGAAQTYRNLSSLSPGGLAGDHDKTSLQITCSKPEKTFLLGD